MKILNFLRDNLSQLYYSSKASVAHLLYVEYLKIEARKAEKKINYREYNLWDSNNDKIKVVGFWIDKSWILT